MEMRGEQVQDRLNLPQVGLCSQGLTLHSSCPRWQLPSFAKGYLAHCQEFTLHQIFQLWNCRVFLASPLFSLSILPAQLSMALFMSRVCCILVVVAALALLLLCFAKMFSPSPHTNSWALSYFFSLSFAQLRAGEGERTSFPGAWCQTMTQNRGREEASIPCENI